MAPPCWNLVQDKLVYPSKDHFIEHRCRYLLASPNIMANKTAKDATDRENLDCIQSLLNRLRIRKDANTVMAANFMMTKSVIT